MKSELLSLPEPFDRSCLLVPRVVDSSTSNGSRRVHQRCFQLLRGNPAQTGANSAGTEIAKFVEAAAEEILQGADGPSHDDAASSGEVAADSESGHTAWLGRLLVFANAVAMQSCINRNKF